MIKGKCHLQSSGYAIEVEFSVFKLTHGQTYSWPNFALSWSVYWSFSLSVLWEYGERVFTTAIWMLKLSQDPKE